MTDGLEHTPTEVVPERLSAWLQATGWKVVGERRDLYVRLQPPNGRDRAWSVLIPLDRTAPEYDELMGYALSTLASERALASTALSAVPLARTVEMDRVRVQRESWAPAGWIPWTEGEELIHTVRSILTAGAKTNRQALKYYGNRFGQFANRYVNSALMGQSGVGSYVVNAFIPVHDEISFTKTEERSAAFPGTTPEARELTESVAQVLGDTREAIDHFQAQGSLAAFQSTALATSYESTVAISRLASNAPESGITIEWDAASPSNRDLQNQFTFTAGDVSALDRASTLLVSTEPARRETITGTVHLLSRSEPAVAGVVGLTTIDGNPSNKVRVRLSPEDYHRALRAHDEGLRVRIRGDLEREGNLWWAYNAVIESTDAPDRAENDHDGTDPLF